MKKNNTACTQCGSPERYAGNTVCRPCRYKQEKEQRVKRSNFINSIKLERGCENPYCQWKGEFTPRMLHFDHIDRSTKTEAIATMPTKTRSFKRISEEIAKCQVLCSNCHAEKSYLSEDWRIIKNNEYS